MLVKLSVHNYALIKRLEVDFSNDFSVITGETGAGKSILLGALGLVLGNRADLTNLKDKTKKCVVEAEFNIASYKLNATFESLDLDYEDLTIIRRELLPSGKSRAFVNDTPVTLKALQTLQTLLLDIHSQNNTLSLSEKDYQYYVIDTLANHQNLLNDYKKHFKEYQHAKKNLANIKQSQADSKQQYDYNLHLYNELKIAKLKEVDEVETLEVNIKKLSFAEDIKTGLFESLNLAINEQTGIQTQFNQLQNFLSKIAPFDDNLNLLLERINSLSIELNDVVQELEHHNENIEADPNALETLNSRLSLLFDLQKKHGVSSLKELIEKQQQLEVKVNQVEDAENLLAEAEKNVKEYKELSLFTAQKITANRKKVIPTFTKQLHSILTHLGMENAQMKIETNSSDQFNEYGVDNLSLLLSSNKGSDFGLLKKVASGGELSRIMLAVKMILSERISLPTILFDEIDTGVSGDIANKMAVLMKQMGEHMQIITITHLPQVASKGKQHYKVYKKVENNETLSYLEALDHPQRINEIAQMLGGKEVSSSALEHAEQLLLG